MSAVLNLLTSPGVLLLALVLVIAVVGDHLQTRNARHRKDTR